MATRAQNEALTEAIKFTPPFGQEYVGPAFAGDFEAVLSLMVSLHDYQRATMVRLLYRARIAPSAFRAALEAALAQTHKYNDVRRVARRWRQFVRWCRYADFPLPSDMPDPVTIYRGAQGDNKLEALKGAYIGHSWTLSRDKAEWFSKRWGHLEGVVVCATVPRSSIMFYSNEREEQEVIPDTLTPPGWKLL